MATGLGSSTFINVNTTRKTVALAGETVSANADRLACMVKLAFRVRAAEDVFTGMSALVSNVGRWTVALVVPADSVAGAGIVFIALDNLDTMDSRVSRCSRRAPAMVTPGCVCADRRYATFAVRSKRLGALVDIVTAHASVARVTRRTGAGEASQRVGAQRALSAEPAGSQEPVALVDVLAESERVAGETGRARAAVAARGVAAQRPLAAKTRRALVNAALVHVYAPSADVRGVEGEADVADAGRLLAVGLAGGVAAALDHLAGRDTRLLGVPDEVFGAVAAVAAVRVGALGVLATGIGQALVDISTTALRRRVYLLESGLALTQEPALGVDAGRVAATSATRQALISINALLLVGRHLVSFLALAEVVDALGIVRAVVERRAFHAHNVPLARLVGVSGVTLGTLAAVASGTVVAQASDGAGILGALVHVEALNPWVSGVALFAGAVVRTHVVQADRVQAASGWPRTFVQVVTTGRQLCLADVSQLAATEVAALRVGAVRVGAAGMRALVDVLAGDLRVSGESGRTLAVETSGGVDARCARSAGELRVQALVHVHASVVGAARKGLVARPALALKAAGKVVAHGVGAARVVSALVDIVTFDRGVSGESVGADALVAARYVVTEGVQAAGVRVLALVNVVAGHGGVAGEASLTLADVVSRQVAALGVLHAQRCQRGYLTLVDVVAVEPVSFVSWKTGAVEAAHGVGAVGEHVARPVLALVLVWHFAAFASVAVVTVAQVVQAGPVRTPGHLGMAMILVCALEVPGQFVRSLETLGHAIA